MKAADFIPYLKKTLTAPDITKLLAKLGVTKPPKRTPGELYTYVQLKKKGLVLAFEESQTERGELFLSAVQIYSAAEKGFSTFPDELPEKLTFSDTRVIAHKKLGKPSEADAREETWERKGYNLIIQFSKDPAGSIEMLHLAVPVRYA